MHDEKQEDACEELDLHAASWLNLGFHHMHLYAVFCVLHPVDMPSMLCRGAYSFIPLFGNSRRLNPISSLNGKANGSGDQARLPTIDEFVLAEGKLQSGRESGRAHNYGRKRVTNSRTRFFKFIITLGPVDRKLAPSKLAFFETNTDPINGCFL